MRTLSQWIVAGVLTGTFSQALAAQQYGPGPEQDHWSWTVSPSVLSPSSTATAQGLSGGFADNIQPSAGAGLTLEASRGVWSFSLDGLYYGANAPISAAFYPGGGEVDSGSQSTSRVLVEAFAYREVVPSLELGLGVVGNSVYASATSYGLTGGSAGGQPFTYSAQRTKNWAVPAFAARWRPFDAGRWSTTLAADVGYWTIDNKSWQIVPSVGYRVSNKVSVLAAYRWMRTLYSIRPGFATDAYDFDSYVHGPALGVGLNF